MKKSIKKGCVLYVVHVTNFREGNKPKLEDFPIGPEFCIKVRPSGHIFKHVFSIIKGYIVI